MFSVFLQPYPCLDTTSHRYRVAFGMGLFVFLFLSVYRPFGLQSLPIGMSQAVFVGYGAVCTVVLLFDLFVLPNLFSSWFDEEKWKVWNEILFVLWNIFTVGLANVFYTTIVLSEELSIQRLLDFQAITLVVAILPVTLLVLIKQLRLMKKNLKAARELSSHMNQKRRLNLHEELLVTLIAENPKDNLTIPAIELLFIRSADNYVEVHYLHENSEQHKLLRASLKTIREDLRQHTAFYRCHRTWIVNLDRVISISGNAQGYKLLLEGTDTRIPVSRNLNKELTQRIAK